MPAESLAKMFDADAILYVTVNRWDAQYVIISTQVTVEIGYKMVSRDGTEIWQDWQKMVYMPDNNSGGLIGTLINAAVARAAPNYMPLTRQANFSAFYGAGAFPNGPYKEEKKK